MDFSKGTPCQFFFWIAAIFALFWRATPPKKGGRKILFQWESAKECVTTHLPKQLALKMDGAKASHLYPAVRSELALAALTTERVGRSHRWRGRLWV